MNIDAEFRRIWWGQDLWRPRQAAAAEDREFFDDNPEVTERLREYVPGEGDSADGFLCFPPECYVVRVTRNGSRGFEVVHRFGPEPEAGPSSAYGEMQEADFDWNDGEAA